MIANWSFTAKLYGSLSWYNQQQHQWHDTTVEDWHFQIGDTTQIVSNSSAWTVDSNFKSCQTLRYNPRIPKYRLNPRHRSSVRGDVRHGSTLDVVGCVAAHALRVLTKASKSANVLPIPMICNKECSSSGTIPPNCATICFDA